MLKVGDIVHMLLDNPDGYPTGIILNTKDVKAWGGLNDREHYIIYLVKSFQHSKHIWYDAEELEKIC